ncbi:MAG TPA: FAD/NAD(P)-binding protein [Actinomycetota bacterium]|nr:FAD/NAD(P)-binding protein [Actinomycetota bacterium]
MSTIYSDIAVVGAGASGTLVATNVLRAATGSVRVALVSDVAELCRGVAYGTKCDDHLLNVPAAGMSAYPDEPTHFLEWAQRRDGSVGPKTFVRRRWYGEYLAELLAGAEKRASRVGAELVRVRARAIQARELRDTGLVGLADGRAVVAKRVVLALGNFPPAALPGCSSTAATSARCIEDPWVPGVLDAIGASDRVLLVGTGLTMYDVFLDLHRTGRGPRVVAISRGGLRPEVHDLSLGPPPQPRFGETSSLSDIARAVEEASSVDAEWRRTIDSVRPLTPGIWNTLTLEERADFLTQWRRKWDVRRHRAAPDVDATIRSHVSNGTLEFKAASIVRIRARNEKLHVFFALPDGENHEDVFDFVINCTGPQSDYRTIQDPLVASLRAAGTLTPCPLGLGIETDATCALTRADGTPSETFFAAGPPTKPMLWEITAIPEIRVQAQALGVRLLEDVKPQQAPVLV